MNFDGKMMITKGFLFGQKRFAKFLLTSAFCSCAMFSTMEANAEIATVSGGAVAYLQAGYLIKDVENDLNKYRAAMIIMSHTDDRNEFLINRDELFQSRELLSFALSTLQEYSRNPLAAEQNELVQLISNLLIKCEAYPNNQNEIVALKNKVRDGISDLPEVFSNLKTAENIIKQKTLSETEQALLERITYLRTEYEDLLKQYFRAKSVVEIDSVAAQLQESYGAFESVMGQAETSFPEVKQVYDTARDFIQKLFAQNGVGNVYYLYLKKVDEQNVIYSYFKKSYSDSIKIIKSLQNKLSTRVDFIS